MTKLDLAIADLKRQLRAYSKSDLIKNVIALQAQVLRLAWELDELKLKLNKQVAIAPESKEVV